jgi:hypothetical protein
MSAGRDQLEKRQPPHSWSRPHSTLVSGGPFVQVLVLYCHPVAESFAAAAKGCPQREGHETENEMALCRLKGGAAAIRSSYFW